MTCWLYSARRVVAAYWAFILLNLPIMFQWHWPISGRNFAASFLFVYASIKSLMCLTCVYGPVFQWRDDILRHLATSMTNQWAFDVTKPELTSKTPQFSYSLNFIVCIGDSLSIDFMSCFVWVQWNVSKGRWNARNVLKMWTGLYPIKCRGNQTIAKLRCWHITSDTIPTILSTILSFQRHEVKKQTYDVSLTC